jgi:hypothetical protein
MVGFVAIVVIVIVSAPLKYYNNKLGSLGLVFLLL